MQLPQLLEVGKLHKTHGVNGELQVQWDAQYYIEAETLESVFLPIEGIPIPFFIEWIRSESDSGCIVKLDEVDTIEQAAEFTSSPILIPKALLHDDEGHNDDVPFKGMIGYSLTDQSGANIGIIKAYDDFSGNRVFTVQHPSGKEAMVPVSEDLIVKIDDNSKLLVMTMPEGLLGVFLD